MKRFLSGLSLLVLVGALVAGVYLVREGRFFLRSRATGVQSAPRFLSVSNLFESGFTVSYLTEQPTEGHLLFGFKPDTLVHQADDVRGATVSSQLHYINVSTDLTDLPNGLYFKICSSSCEAAKLWGALGATGSAILTGEVDTFLEDSTPNTVLVVPAYAFTGDSRSKVLPVPVYGTIGGETLENIVLAHVTGEAGSRSTKVATLVRQPATGARFSLEFYNLRNLALDNYFLTALDGGHTGLFRVYGRDSTGLVAGGANVVGNNYPANLPMMAYILPNPQFTPPPATCKLGGLTCSVSGNCCSGVCQSGVCVGDEPPPLPPPPLCKPDGGTCSSNIECCSISCAAGVCAPAVFQFNLGINVGIVQVLAGNQATANITVSPISGIAESVSLQVGSILPAGVQLQFAPQSCIPNCQSQMTVTTSLLTPVGTYQVRIDGVSAGGSTASQDFDLVVGTPPPPPPPPPAAAPALPVTLKPSGDSYVDGANPTVNYGTKTSLQSDGSPIYISYLKFDLTGLAGATVTSAKLKLKISNTSGGTQNVKKISDDSWIETGITYNSRPTPGATTATFTGPSLEWKIVDITSYVKEELGGQMTVAVDSTSSDGLWFNSKEATADKPELEIQ